MNTNVQNNENIDSQNDEIEEVEDLKDGATPEEKEAHYAKIESRNKQLYARIKKAEGFENKDGKWVKKPVEQPVEDNKTVDTSKLSQSDIITLARADLDDNDMSEVVEYATFKKISISEALKAPVIKNMIAESAEKRKVAEGTNTGGGRRGNGKLTDEALLSNSKKGELPESEEDMKRLARLTLGIR